MKVPGWDCRDGTPDEDHDWRLIPGEPDVGTGDQMQCQQCGRERPATDDEIAASYDDSDL